MLEDFNYWLALKDKSTLTYPLPWYYSAGFLNIEFWSNPAVLAAVLPWELGPDSAAKEYGTVAFYC
jgi:acetoacetate decarboxylase